MTTDQHRPCQAGVTSRPEEPVRCPTTPATGSWRNPTLTEWAETLGAGDAIEHIPQDNLQDPNLRFRVLHGSEREAVFLKVSKVLQNHLERAGDHRKARWIAGWQETLDEFTQSGFNLATLRPKFVRGGEIMRLGKDYIQPATDCLEPAMVGVLRHYLFSRFFSNTDTVYEFGAGTGHNMVALASQYPTKTIHAMDWVEPSVRIFDLLREKHGLNIHGHLFDLAHPNPGLRLEPGSAVLTVGALEQLGDRFMPFLEFLVDRKPSICLHVETLRELYDTSDFFDWLGAQYLEKRGYLNGLLTALRHLESQGRIEILKAQRTFGCTYHDGYNYVVWRPLKG